MEAARFSPERTPPPGCRAVNYQIRRVTYMVRWSIFFWDDEDGAEPTNPIQWC
jgi:hypothetical protein